MKPEIHIKKEHATRKKLLCCLAFFFFKKTFHENQNSENQYLQIKTVKRTPNQREKAIH